MNADPAVRPPIGSKAAAGTLGVLRIGTLEVALPVDALREVLPRPTAFAPLPAHAPGLVGSLSVRGRVLPVLDLSRALLEAAREDGEDGGVADGGDDGGDGGGDDGGDARDAASDTDREPVHAQDGAAAGALVAVVHHEGRAIGLLADAVRGLVRPAAGSISPMCRADGGRLCFSGSFARDGDGGIVHVLEADALIALAGVPSAEVDGRADADAHQRSQPDADTGTNAESMSLMLVRGGGLFLAIDVADVHATLPAAVPRPSALQGPGCRGQVRHADVWLPAVDPMALLGLGALSEGGAHPSLVLGWPGGRVALLVDAVLDIVRVPIAALRPLPPLLVREPGRFRGTLRVDGLGEHLVLRTGALHAHPTLAALSTLNTAVTDGGEDAGTAGAGRGARAPADELAMLTYDIGTETASALAQIVAVTALPEDIAPLGAGMPGVLGLHTGRDVPTTLVCLATVAGGTPSSDPAQARVLHVEVDGARFGFVVSRLLRIDRAGWQATLPAIGSSGASRRASAIVEIGTGHERRTLQRLDLHAIARTLCAAAAVQS